MSDFLKIAKQMLQGQGELYAYSKAQGVRTAG